MLRRNVENHSDERDDVELSRRSFFGRLAAGAVLSIAMPGVVYASKSESIKAGKNNKSARTAVRLPKHRDQAAKSGRQTSKVRHAANKHQNGLSDKLSKNRTANKHKSTLAERGHLPEQHAHQNARVKDVYSKKNHETTVASNYSNRIDHHSGRMHSIIQPTQGGQIIESTQDQMFFADHGRIATHRSLAFQNPHTGDKLSLTYFEKGRYLSDALNEISFVLRDYRTGDVHPIDPELLDQLHNLKQMLGLSQPFHVISGYRSPMTNAKLHAEHSGVANNSFHMYGRAVDIRIERFDLRRIHNAALAMHLGGVGYYPDSNFIHLDTGTFRTWSL